MRLVQRILFTVVLLSLVRATAPRLAEAVREAFELRGLPRQERRLEAFGPFYEAVSKINAAIVRDEPVAIITGPNPAGALFTNYYLFPAKTKFYTDFTSYRVDPAKPQQIIRGADIPQLQSYAEARAAEIGPTHVVKHFQLPEEPRRSFFIPLASSGDGYPPDRWATEALLRNPSSQEARVTLRFPPARKSAVVTLKPGETRMWNDVVYQLFSVLDIGWLEIESNQPLLANFWFVNRATGDADMIPFATLGRTFRFPHHSGSRIWLINPHESELPLRMNGGDGHGVPPLNVVPLEWIGDLHIESDAGMYAYQSWRTETCCTGFRWPEESK